MRMSCRVLICLLALASLPLAAQDLRVAVVSNDFVLPDKVERLDALARPAGVRFVHVPVTAGGATDTRLAGHDLVLLDTPRASDVADVEQALGDALAQAGAPWVRIGGGAPAGDGLPRADILRIAGYYAGGGEANLRHLAAFLQTLLRNGDPAAVPAPVALPATGYYHPDAPMVFEAAGAYLEWRAQQATPDEAPGTVALLIAPGSVASLQTAVADAVIVASRAHGVHAFGLWVDGDAPDALQTALDGIDVDAIVNMTHLQQVPLRAAEFARLDVPVLQTLNWRQGTPAQWRAADSGVAMPLVPTFLAVPEAWGASDPLVISAVSQGAQVPIPEQVDLLAAKLARLAALRHQAAADRQLALMFWNYPGGETNLSASHLNVPRSIVAIADALRAHGYTVDAADEAGLIADAQAMLAALYRPDTLDALRARGLAGTVPLATYEHWLQTLPAERREAVLQRHGAPADSPAMRVVDGTPVLVIPRLALGHLALLPQPPRGARRGESSHDLTAVPDHRYLATYLYLRTGLQADALIHLGTHGSQEWTPGKDRGLWAFDWPFALLGDLPVFYPYIQDNVGEAVQAKRRGRAVTVSHQVPPVAPAGLYDELRDLHGLVHQPMQVAQFVVEAGRRDRRHLVTDRHRAPAPLGLHGLADVVLDVGIEHRQIAEQRERPVERPQAAILARRPFLAAMRAEMDQCVGLQARAQVQVGRQIPVVGHGGEVVTGLAPPRATRRLRQQCEMPQCQPRNHQHRRAVDDAHRRTVGRRAMTLQHRLAPLGRQRLQPVLVGRQRHRAGQSTRPQRIERVRAVQRGEHRLRVGDQAGLVRGVDRIAVCAQGIGDRDDAARHVEMRGRQIGLAARVVPEHQGQLPVGRSLVPQCGEAGELGGQQIDLLGNRDLRALRHRADHQRIGRAPGFGHREEGRHQRHRDAAVGGAPLGRRALAPVQGLQHRHVETRELRRAQWHLLQVGHVHDRVDVDAVERGLQRVWRVTVDPQPERVHAVGTAGDDHRIGDRGLQRGDRSGRDQQRDRARGLVRRRLLRAPFEIRPGRFEHHRRIGVVVAGRRQRDRRRHRRRIAVSQQRLQEGRQVSQIGFAAAGVVPGDAQDVGARQSVTGRRSTADPHPRCPGLRQCIAERLFDVGDIRSAWRVEQHEVVSGQARVRRTSGRHRHVHETHAGRPGQRIEAFDLVRQHEVVADHGHPQVLRRQRQAGQRQQTDQDAARHPHRQKPISTFACR